MVQYLKKLLFIDSFYQNKSNWFSMWSQATVPHYMSDMPLNIYVYCTHLLYTVCVWVHSFWHQFTHYDLKFVYQMYTSTQSEEQHLHTTLDLFD